MANKIRGNGPPQLSTLLSAGTVGTLSDGQLLERFANGCGEPRESAFAALVERHGPLVLRVCRSVLRDTAAADDAFQATFLALARKAGSLWARDSLAPWLHQAAYRAAVHDRSARLRRRAHEQAAAALRSNAPATTHVAHDDGLGTILHEEVDRLPRGFRAAVVLCDLEGRTHEQAAHHLGCAVGTVKSRLARGRKRLRARLVRRGVAPASALSALGASRRASAAVPKALAESTVAYAATAKAVPTTVAVLTESVLNAMFLNKTKLGLTVTAAAVVSALVAGAMALAQLEAGRSKEGIGKVPSPHVGSTSGKGQARPKVVLTSPRRMDLTITFPYACEIQAQRHIGIQSLEEGIVDTILVKEGQVVQKGDVIFTIRPILDKDRGAAGASKVFAPFEGRIGRIREPIGSLLKQGDILTTLSDTSVVWVYFQMSERSYLDDMARGHSLDDDRIELVLADRKKLPQPGKLGAVAAEFNNRTGTLPVRVDFPNSDGVLRHGQSGTVLIHREIKNALVIPQAATFEVRDRRYAYVVDHDGVVHQRPIVVEHESDEIFVIKKGLGVGDRIVLEGARAIHDGEKVDYRYRPPAETK